MRTYSELITLPTIEERYQYLKLDGQVGRETFGWERWMNQKLYRSKEWRRFRNEIIVRDGGCDLAMDGYEIYARGQIHHINPITVESFVRNDPAIFDPENVVLVSLRTHNAIHYGDATLLPEPVVERRPNDQCPWLH